MNQTSAFHLVLSAWLVASSINLAAAEPSPAANAIEIKRLLDTGNPNAFAYVAQDLSQPDRKRPLSLLMLAAQKDDIALCRELLAKGAAVNLHLDNDTALHAAVRAGRVNTARLLLEAGAHPDFANQDGNGALLVATQNGDIETVRLLLDFGADPNNARIYLKGPSMRAELTITPLIAALEAKRLDIAQVLLERGADINALVFNPGSQWLYNALGFSIYRGDIEQSNFLFERGASVDSAPPPGDAMAMKYNIQIPLAQALVSGDPLLVKFLLTRGANMAAKTYWGLTIAHIVAPGTQEKRSIAALQWLAEQGAPIDLKDKTNLTPLALAVSANRLSTARVLLALGADPEVALPYSTRNPDMTRLLLAARKQ